MILLLRGNRRYYHYRPLARRRARARVGSNDACGTLRDRDRAYGHGVAAGDRREHLLRVRLRLRVGGGDRVGVRVRLRVGLG